MFTRCLACDSLDCFWRQHLEIWYSRYATTTRPPSSPCTPSSCPSHITQQLYSSVQCNVYARSRCFGGACSDGSTLKSVLSDIQLGLPFFTLRSSIYAIWKKWLFVAQYQHGRVYSVVDVCPKYPWTFLSWPKPIYTKRP